MITLPHYPSFFAWCLRNPAPLTLNCNPHPHPWDVTRLHASDLGATLPEQDGGCMRKVWLRIHGYAARQHTDGEMLMLLKSQVIHELLGQWMVERLHAWNPDWRVSAIEEAMPDMEGGTGRLDVAVEHVPTGEQHVLDFKSVRGAAFDHRDFPYASHLWQVAAYAKVKGFDQYCILYTDREGQNFMRQTGPHPRMDTQISEAWAALNGLKRVAEPPPCVSPAVAVQKRKTTAGAVAIDVPFQCSYCRLRDVSCPTALPPDRRGKVAGHLAADGGFRPVAGLPAELAQAVEAALARKRAAEDALGLGVGEAGAGADASAGDAPEAQEGDEG